MSYSLKEITDHYRHTLSHLYDQEEINAIAFLAIEAVAGFKKVHVALNPNEIVPLPVYTKLVEVLHALEEEKPIQYILGFVEFYGLRLEVNQDVLIPRQETEELVDWIIKDANRIHNDSLSIIDIGTGSGCIAISLKKNLSKAHVFALDVSEKALATARENAKQNNAEIYFIIQDILDPGTLLLDQKFDVVVSNPPYVLNSEKALMKNNVLIHEPHLALFVEDGDPLLYYDAIANFGLEKLHPGGRLYFEINEIKGEDIKKMLHEKGFIEIEMRKDLNGKDRMIKCVRV
jgi:release factor glutamine methyltransferase